MSWNITNSSTHKRARERTHTHALKLQTWKDVIFGIFEIMTIHSTAYVV
jgi:hypothetical protein